MRPLALTLALLALALPALAADQAPPQNAPISDATQMCLDCHAMATPTIVADWRRGRMSRVSPAMALKKPEDQRRISGSKIPEALLQVAVGCAECHTLNPDQHPGTFDHEGTSTHTVVSPRDCAVCHPTEADQFAKNLMSQAVGNLKANPLHHKLMKQINGVQELKQGGLVTQEPTRLSQNDSCYSCHGTAVKVEGKTTISSPDFGDITVAKLVNWPNRGVGRVNPDGSKGACSACHSRHQFSIAMARKPHTCSECHAGPDVVAYKVYSVSKHGNLFQAMGKEWDFEAVPWTLGRDLIAPTCATCHVSLLKDTQGNTVAKRTHQMNDRLWWRLLGLIYSHPHPKDPDTSKIKSPDGLPLATALDGRLAKGYLIDQSEQAARKATMTGVCRACHSTQWVAGQMALLDETIRTSDAMVLAATKLMQEIWQAGLAQGPAAGGSPFDEFVERLWTEEWLLHANSVRFATAMMGADYGVFDNGRWPLARNLRQMQDWMEQRKDQGKKKPQ